MLYNFRPPLLPQYMPLRENVKAAGGPPEDYLMRSIRDVAVFAWALVGINGTLERYSHGHPHGEAVPPDGLPIWDPHAPPQPPPAANYQPPPHNQAAARWAAYDRGVINKGKAPAPVEAPFRGQNGQNGYHAPAANRDLPLPVFGMPGYLLNAPRYAYQASGLAYGPPLQQGQHYTYNGHANEAFHPEPRRDEQSFFVHGDQLRNGSRAQGPYTNGWASGR